MSLPAPAPSASAEPATEGLLAPVFVEPDQAIVQVNGVVCSFCAHGAEKGLATLESLDHSYFGNGVLIDINTHRITLAVRPGEPLPIREIYRIIKKAGYDPVTLHVRVSGRVESTDSEHSLLTTASAQTFSFSPARGNLTAKRTIDIQAHLDARVIPSLNDGDAVPVEVDAVYSPAVDGDENG